MKKLLSLCLITILLSSCGLLQSPEAIHEVLVKELPNKTWLTTKIPMNSSTEYTSLTASGLLQRINFYSNTSYYKLTEVGWPFVVNYKEGDYQGYGEAEVATHYITDFNITKMDFVGTEEVTAYVDVTYAVTEFIADRPETKNLLAGSDPVSELCYDVTHVKSTQIKLRKYDDGWHIDRDSKEAVEQLVQSTEGLMVRQTPDTTNTKVCLPYSSLRVQSSLVYDDDGGLSTQDPLKELDFSGDRPFSNAKLVITGNVNSATLRITEIDNDNKVLIDKNFNLAGSVEFVFPVECERLKIDLKSNEGKILYQDFMNFSCGG